METSSVSVAKTKVAQLCIAWRAKRITRTQVENALRHLSVVADQENDCAAFAVFASAARRLGMA